ncbi:MAG: ABC transporter ATP-binding protein [Thermoflexales bacterium]|nr:ABC transporter ATP-binding protein [Thermoflexales bacterium]
MAVIQFQAVSKRYILHHQRPRSFQEAVIGILKRSNKRREEFWALRDFTLQVEPGEVVGIIGNNGAGKSTVLKLAARIIEPTQGKVIVKGRVGALLELGVGFHPDLTGRENIYLNGAILGLNRREMGALLDRIVEFAEMDQFIDIPVKHYSSGMLVRLGFAVATSVRPAVLLVDEVLAVGDLSFRKKCLQRIQEMREEGTAILYVSHALDEVRRVCHRAIWLDSGIVRADGHPEEVVKSYVEDTARKRGEGTRGGLRPFLRMGSGEVEITGAATVDIWGRECDTFVSGASFAIRIDYYCHQPVSDLAFGVGIYAEDGTWVTSPNSLTQQAPIKIKKRGSVYYFVESLPLRAGVYDVTVAVFDGSAAPLYLPYDHLQNVCRFTIVERGKPMPQDGLVEFPHQWLDEEGWCRFLKKFQGLLGDKSNGLT